MFNVHTCALCIGNEEFYDHSLGLVPRICINKWQQKIAAATVGGAKKRPKIKKKKLHTFTLFAVYIYLFRFIIIIILKFIKV